MTNIFQYEIKKYTKNKTHINKINLDIIPNTNGIYMVGLSETAEPIEFLENTSAKIKSSYTVADLIDKYKTGNKEILYIGKAETLKSKNRGLKKRLKELLQFANSECENHSGGKDLWRIKNWQKELVIYWCEVNNARMVEKHLLELHAKNFPSEKGKKFSYPFANWQS